MTSIKTLMNQHAGDLQALIEQRRAVARKTVGEGLRRLFEENLQLWSILRVRQDSYDDNCYYDAEQNSYSDTIIINGDSRSYNVWQSGKGMVARPGFEELYNLQKKVEQFFDVSDSDLDDAFGRWTEIRATWDRATSSVDVIFS